MDCAGGHFALFYSSANVRIASQVLAFVEVSLASVAGSTIALAAIIVVPTTALPVLIFVGPTATFPWPLLIVVVVAAITATVLSLAEATIAIFTLVAAEVTTVSLSGGRVDHDHQA